jgi:hypothetical protein
LSRERSLAADCAAFETAEGRAELPTDAIAMMADTLQTLRDLLTFFPIVQRVERARLALDLTRNPEVVPIARRQMKAIEAAAAKSGIVTKEGARLLRSMMPLWTRQQTPYWRRVLSVTHYLCFFNFGSVVSSVAGLVSSLLAKGGKRLAVLADKSWSEIEEKLPAGIGLVAIFGPILILVDNLSHPYAQLV